MRKYFLPKTTLLNLQSARKDGVARSFLQQSPITAPRPTTPNQTPTSTSQVQLPVITPVAPSELSIILTAIKHTRPDCHVTVRIFQRPHRLQKRARIANPRLEPTPHRPTGKCCLAAQGFCCHTSVGIAACMSSTIGCQRCRCCIVHQHRIRCSALGHPTKE
jgi:hypothetical protein